MTNPFFAKLAGRNIRSNSQVYLPYMVASFCTVMMFHMVNSLMANEYVRTYSDTLSALFLIGTVVVGIFSTIFILYSNSFLIKRRKKELGLYAILGLEKKHVAKVLSIETALTSIVIIAGGILAGHILGKLSFMGLNYFLDFPVSMDYTFSFRSIFATAALFVGIFLAALAYNLTQVTFSKPIKLLKGGNEGEKEPRGSVLIFLLSIACLAWGYWLSLTVENPFNALMSFFWAVLLVILGTYFFFISGSLFVLRALKRNKAFYYRPGNFISISGMIYRMKQNAVGLANICILISMVIVAISTTYAIFSGTEEVLKTRFPYENSLTVKDMPIQDRTVLDEWEESIRSQTEDSGLEMEDYTSYRYQERFGFFEKGRFRPDSLYGAKGMPDFLMLMIPWEDYQKAAPEPVELQGDQVLIHSSREITEAGQVTLGQHTFRAERLDELPFEIEEMDILSTVVIIFPQADIMGQVAAEMKEALPDESLGEGLKGIIGWNTKGTDEAKAAYIAELEKLVAGQSSVSYESRDGNREEWYALNGGLLFLGLFLGSLFTIGTAMITYFKQVSEGFADRGRFQTMQKVGLDKRQIRKSTKVQMFFMFFLPLLLAAIHVSFAYPILQKMLIMFGITNEIRVISSIAAVILAFGLIDWLIYRVTSRVYFNIVKD